MLWFIAYVASCLIAVSSIDPWTCIELQSTVIDAASNTIWKTENCTMGDPELEPPLLTVNSVIIDLSSGNVRAVPAVALDQLSTVPDMATQNPNFIAGINGGYFWRVGKLHLSKC